MSPGSRCPFNSPTALLIIYDAIFTASRVPKTHRRVGDDRFPNPRPYDIFEILTIGGILPIKILPPPTVVEHRAAYINNTECALLSIYAVLTDSHANHSAATGRCRLTVKTKIDKSLWTRSVSSAEHTFTLFCTALPKQSVSDWCRNAVLPHSNTTHRPA